MTTYEDLDEALRNTRNDRKKLARNTWAERRNHAIAIRFHQTDVVTVHEDGRITLDSGGWHTMSTKDRINRFAPHGKVVSDRGAWFVQLGPFTHPFFDGITYLGDTLISSPDEERQALEALGEDARTKQAVRDYINDFGPEQAAMVEAALTEGNTRSDCLICQVGSDDGFHLQEHIEERYYVPTLFVRAFEERGYGSWQAALSMGLKDVQRGRDAWQIEHALRPYLLKRLLVGATAYR